MYPHRIHLHGPWECEPLTRTALQPDGRIEPVAGPVPPRLRMTVPCRWAEGGLGPFMGQVRYRRKFHWPGRLDYYERLWLVFCGADYFARVWLNGEELGRHEGAFDPFEFEVTRLVHPRNELLVEVSSLSGDNGGLWGDVALEVRRETFLRDVRVWAEFGSAEPVLHVTGEVVGETDATRRGDAGKDDAPESPRPRVPASPRRLECELYVLLDGSTLLYQVLTGPGPFRVSVVTPGVQLWWPRGMESLGRPRLYDVQVDLVQGASQLDSQLFPFGFRWIAYRPESEVLQVNGVTLPREHWPRPLRIAQPIKHIRLDEANRLGTPLWLDVPAMGLSPEGHWRHEAQRQREVVLRLLQPNPAVFGLAP